MVSSESTRWRGALVRRWAGTSPDMEQPPLDHHYIVMHLGGPKHVNRRNDGPSVSTIAEHCSITLVPAGMAHRWSTRGPIGFAHVYLRPEQFDVAMDSELDGASNRATLTECVGNRDPILAPLVGRMLEEIHGGSAASSLLLDSLLDCVLVALARRHSSRGPRDSPPRLTIAPHRLRHVIDFIESHLGSDLRLLDLAAVAEMSASHFSHAFRAATGESPYCYVTLRRVEYAQVLLLAGNAPLQSISEKCGFQSRQQFAVMFKRHVGIGPKRFRLDSR
ncbi:MAG: AraC family transcriptional regulator [Rubrivivax sp.]